MSMLVEDAGFQPGPDRLAARRSRASLIPPSLRKGSEATGPESEKKPAAVASLFLTNSSRDFVV
jgi:hypothetical protein